MNVLTPRGREVLVSRLESGEHPLDAATHQPQQNAR